MKAFLFLFCFIFSALSLPQTLIESFSFPQYTYYNYFWGVTEKDGYFWIGTQFNNNGPPPSRFYKVTKTGVIVDSMLTPFRSNCGVEWDGNNFWIARNNDTIFRMSPSGVAIDTFKTPSLNGSSALVGDLAYDGNKMWYTVFSPDFTTYPNGYAFAFDTDTKEIIDTIPLRGRQVLGIAVKGDTVFYVNEDQYSSEDERIYAYSKSLGDTLFSFPTPDPDGNCNPKGLHWDGEYLWLIAERIGSPSWVYKALYKYAITGQGNPVVAVSPLSINFGSVPLGTTGESFVTISNTGNANLLVNNFVFSNPVFSSPGISFPDTIPPGGNIIYPVHFSPNQFDSAFCTLGIHTNDGGTPVKNVSLNGKGVYTGAYIYTAGNQVNYGGRRVNSKSGYDIVIENRGNAALLISSASFATSRFIFDTTGVQFPVSIPSETSRTFKLWFNPTQTIQYSDSLTILSDAVNEPVKKIFASGSAFENPAVLGDVLWQMVIPINPQAYTNDLEPTSMKVIEDVNYDGINDLIVTSRNYYTLCINGNSSITGDVIWKFNTSTNNNNTGSVGFIDAMQVRSDVNGDGIQDVVIGCGGGNEFVYTICGRTGNMIWAYGDSINYSNGDINGLRADKDFNGDNIPDVLISASGSSSGGRHAAICLNGVNGSEIFNMPQSASFTFDITTTQSGGLICVDLGNGGPYYVNSFNNSGIQQWTTQIPEIGWSLKETKDVNNDGVKDFVGFSGGINVNVYSRSGANGSVIWNHSYPNFATFANISIISDLDSNGFEDMIFSGKEGIRRIDTKTGTVLWSNPLDNTYTFGVDEYIDITGDNYKEILAGTYNAYLYVLNGLTGAVIFQYNTGAPINNAVERVRKMPSIDGNYSYEIAAVTDDGRIFCFSGGPYVPVPVELNSFTAAADEKNVILKWSTATELNNKGFEIERRRLSTGTVNNPEIIAFIPGKGTVSEPSEYVYVDSDPGKGKYTYSLIQIDFDGTRNIEGSVEVQLSNIPAEFSLHQNYPNPFNPSTIIKFSLPADSRVRLKIYNALGEAVHETAEEIIQAGYSEYTWNAGSYSSGVYYYSLTASPVSGGKEYHAVKKMLLLK